MNSCTGMYADISLDEDNEKSIPPYLKKMYTKWKTDQTKSFTFDPANTESNFSK